MVSVPHSASIHQLVWELGTMICAWVITQYQKYLLPYRSQMFQADNIITWRGVDEMQIMFEAITKLQLGR